VSVTAAWCTAGVGLYRDYNCQKVKFKTWSLKVNYRPTRHCPCFL